MESASMRRSAASLDQARRLDWGAVWTWLLCFGLVAYLGLEGGGYDPLVHDKAGLVVWWVLLLAVAVGALPRRRPTRLAWVALGLLAAFAVWTALSLIWTESVDRTSADLARIVGYVGVFALVSFSRGSRESQRVIGAVAAGIVLVALVGLLSRLHPAWFPEATQTAQFLIDRERLSYPLEYWNGLAGLIAIGLPLVLQVATCARGWVTRALAAAALPALVLAIFFTLSRGGIAAAVLALAIFFALSSDRLPKLLTLFIAGAGGAILVAAADSRNALQHGLSNDAAHHQGSQLLWIAIVVCAVVGLLQLAISSPGLGRRRPAWTRISRRNAAIGMAAALLVLAIAALALGAPGRVSHGWDEFKRGGGPGSGAGRLGSVAGQSRYQLWSAAVRENATDPLVGTGSGTFEFWWERDGDTTETVRDTHSLYLQTLGELGIVGLALLAAFLLAIVIGGWQRLRSADARGRARLAAAAAGFTAFCITAVYDWMWQLPVLAVAMLVLATVFLAPDEARPVAGLRLPLRLGIVLACLAAIAAIAIPLASTSLLRESEADARNGDLTGAVRDARTAQNVQPGAAGPRLQQALVLEAQGDLPEAAEAARAATEREATDWRNWLVLSRIEAERGRAVVAVAAYRKAKSLNPRSSLFAG